MAHRLSTRISLRWLPDAPSEPTDTLVFNVGSYFMDLRVLKADTSIDWGMAGERAILSTDPRTSVSPPLSPLTKPRQLTFALGIRSTVKCRWTKLIDSLGPSDPDEGTFTSLPNGDYLEVGSMPHPDTDEMTEYEEVFRQLTPRPGVKRAWILQSDDEKTFLGRIGGNFMALCEGKEGFCARSEEWDEGERQWRVKYAIGGLEGVASFADTHGVEFEGEGGWKEGQKVVVSGKQYVVRSLEAL